MSKLIDLTGKRFGRWTVLKRVDNSKYGQPRWLCRCDCGKERAVNAYRLRNGDAQSCGCQGREAIRDKTDERYEVMTGERFGFLVVIGYAGRSKPTKTHPSGMPLLKCRCDCGKTLIAFANNIKRVTTKSCGCMAGELGGQKRRKDLTGQKFGKLTAVKFTGSNKYGYQWLCECECGNSKIVSIARLHSGRTTDCGCRPGGLEKGVSAFRRIYYRYISGAKKRGLEFLITEAQFRELTKRNCHYCGCKPAQVNGEDRVNSRSHGAYIYNGIDRVDSNKGYAVDNCVPCCGTCNYMKRALSKDEFLSHINRIVGHQQLNREAALKELANVK